MEGGKNKLRFFLENFVWFWCFVDYRRKNRGNH